MDSAKIKKELDKILELSSQKVGEFSGSFSNNDLADNGATEFAKDPAKHFDENKAMLKGKKLNATSMAAVTKHYTEVVGLVKDGEYPNFKSIENPPDFVMLANKNLVPEKPSAVSDVRLTTEDSSQVVDRDLDNITSVTTDDVTKFYDGNNKRIIFENPISFEAETSNFQGSLDAYKDLKNITSVTTDDETKFYDVNQKSIIFESSSTHQLKKGSTIQFQHLSASPVAFSMLPEHDFVKPDEPLSEQKFFFGNTEQLNDFTDKEAKAGQPTAETPEGGGCIHEQLAFQRSIKKPKVDDVKQKDELEKLESALKKNSIEDLTSSDRLEQLMDESQSVFGASIKVKQHTNAHKDVEQDHLQLPLSTKLKAAAFGFAPEAELRKLEEKQGISRDPSMERRQLQDDLTAAINHSTTDPISIKLKKFNHDEFEDEPNDSFVDLLCGSLDAVQRPSSLQFKMSLKESSPEPLVIQKRLLSRPVKGELDDPSESLQYVKFYAGFDSHPSATGERFPDISGNLTNITSVTIDNETNFYDGNQRILLFDTPSISSTAKLQQKLENFEDEMNARLHENFKDQIESETEVSFNDTETKLQESSTYDQPRQSITRDLDNITAVTFENETKFYDSNQKSLVFDWIGKNSTKLHDDSFGEHEHSFLDKSNYEANYDPRYFSNDIEAYSQDIIDEPVEGFNDDSATLSEINHKIFQAPETKQKQLNCPQISKLTDFVLELSPDVEVMSFENPQSRRTSLISKQEAKSDELLGETSKTLQRHEKLGDDLETENSPSKMRCADATEDLSPIESKRVCVCAAKKASPPITNTGTIKKVFKPSAVDQERGCDRSWPSAGVGELEFAIKSKRSLGKSTKVSSLTQMIQPGCEAAIAKAEKLKFEDDDGYMDLTKHNIDELSGVTSSTWIDENDSFSFVKEPSIRRAPLGSVAAPKLSIAHEDEPTKTFPQLQKKESKLRKCKCFLMRMSQVLRKGKE